MIHKNKCILVWVFALVWRRLFEPSRGSMILGADWLSWPDWASVARRVEDTGEAANIFRCRLLKNQIIWLRILNLITFCFTH